MRYVIDAMRVEEVQYYITTTWFQLCVFRWDQ